MRNRVFLCRMTDMTSENKPSEEVLASAREYAEDVVRQSGSSFFWAMRTLPEVKRLGMYAVYAFCREVDDIADEPGLEEDKRAELEVWRNEVEGLFQDKPKKTVGLALLNPISMFGLHKNDFVAVIDGMVMDAGDGVRIKDMDELKLYCDRVACAVGRLSNRVFGIDEEHGDLVADALGNALQLTNILRDVTEDAERNRLYLPADKLKAAGIDVPGLDGDLSSVLAAPELAGVCEELSLLADDYFTKAQEYLADCDQQLMRPAIVMMQMYHRIFELLKRRGWQDLDQPVGLSKMEKLWVGVRYGMF